MDVIEDGRVIDTTVAEVTVGAGEVRELGNVFIQEKSANDSVNE